MFSNRGEEQFVPHETMAVEHFAEIYFAPGGFSFLKWGLINPSRPLFQREESFSECLP
jgi:hypothetical protein